MSTSQLIEKAVHNKVKIIHNFKIVPKIKRNEYYNPAYFMGKDEIDIVISWNSRHYEFDVAFMFNDRVHKELNLNLNLFCSENETLPSRELFLIAVVLPISEFMVATDTYYKGLEMAKEVCQKLGIEYKQSFNLGDFLFSLEDKGVTLPDAVKTRLTEKLPHDLTYNKCCVMIDSLVKHNSLSINQDLNLEYDLTIVEETE